VYYALKKLKRESQTCN